MSIRVLDVDDRPGEVSARIWVAGQHHLVRWRGPDLASPPPGAADAMLATTLLPAMAVGTHLDPGGPVSHRLLGNLARLQEVLLTWDAYTWQQGLHRVAVAAPAATGTGPPPASGVGCFFSGGVDSFFTALRHREEITHLIFVRGIDFFPLDSPHDRRLRTAVHRAADELGKPVLEVETNVRRFSDPYIGWGRYHGGALAAIAMLLGSSVGKVYVPASDTWATLSPWGSHPALDPLWGTEYLGLVHDGCDRSRADKVASFAGQPAPLGGLQVCWQERGEAVVNCGRCDKCVRTMATLRLAGLLEQCQTFPDGLSLRQVSRLDMSSPGSKLHWRRYLARLESDGTDPDLARAIRRALSPRRQHLRVETERLARQPTVRRLARAARRLRSAR